MTESRLVVFWGWERKEADKERITRVQEKILGGTTYMFSILTVVMVSRVCSYVRTYQIVHFKPVQSSI